MIIIVSILALIVENTFSSIPHMAQLMVPGASSLPRLFFKNKVTVVVYYGKYCFCIVFKLL